MKVSILLDGGKEVRNTISAIGVDSSTMGNEMKYNSETDGDDDDFSFYNRLIGKTTKIRLDKDDDIIFSSDDQNQFRSMQHRSPGLTTSDQYDRLNRMGGVMPKEDKIIPTDTWDFTLDMKDEDYSGRATYLGYTTYDTYDVAVVKMDAILSQSVDGEGVGSNSSHSGFKEGRLNGYMYWDVKDNFARWTELNLSTMTKVPDPLDSRSSMEIPFKETIIMYAHYKPPQRFALV
eukprot:CAMPEP_0197233928 /NCGR_PEP_ID=MMETSP1429-20130617/1837_1 /TAXON_ID=49237 /ORGANISM="Chaetoceros  sp., Strain UNC1202" /LENGTH=232 /DNA_ID=CAMNT_0042692245 /DNA_START=20 /DNA_END=718 /DNA_ORIENTATION=-